MASSFRFGSLTVALPKKGKKKATITHTATKKVVAKANPKPPGFPAALTPPKAVRTVVVQTAQKAVLTAAKSVKQTIVPAAISAGAMIGGPVGASVGQSIGNMAGKAVGSVANAANKKIEKAATPPKGAAQKSKATGASTASAGSTGLALEDNTGNSPISSDMPKGFLGELFAALRRFVFGGP